jgi:hypothetical protein
VGVFNFLLVLIRFSPFGCGGGGGGGVNLPKRLKQLKVEFADW